MDGSPFQYQKREYWTFYCPICKAERRSVYWPSPRPKHYARLGLFVILAGAALWPIFGLKALIFPLPVWPLFEFYYRARARQALICPHCGFDPYLYKYDVKLARSRMERFWSDKKPASSSVEAEPNSNAPLKK
jgi:hypothetical protein